MTPTNARFLSPATPSAVSPYDHWLPKLGFVATHEPGVSRAWRLDLEAGYLLVTDLGGYDLPEVGSAASAYLFRRTDDLIEFAEILGDSQTLYQWIRHARRRLERAAVSAARRVPLNPNLSPFILCGRLAAASPDVNDDEIAAGRRRPRR